MTSSLLRPQSVAVVGASDDPTKTTARPVKFLRQSGWKGRLYPVNPSRSTVLGETAWASISALPEVPEHVYVLTGADTALETVDLCVTAGVGTVTLVADGFVGQDSLARARRERLLSTIKGSATRVLGPSSLGVVTIEDGLYLTANAAFAEQDLQPGGIFVASQSGSVIGAIASRGRSMGLGFAGMVSTGNELDLTLGEICSATLDDPAVTSYALFLESLQHADTLREFALGAAERGKSVLAYKLGRSDAAATLSVSHTGALAGDETATNLLLADLGFGRVLNFEALLEGQALAGAVAPGSARLGAPRVAVVSTTGGGGAMVTDCLALRGADVRAPSDATVARLKAAGIDPGQGVLIDLTLAGTKYQLMRSCLEILAASGEYDVIVAAPGSSARFNPELTVKPIVDASTVCGTPLVSFVVPDAPDALVQLRSAGLSAFRTPESCADAVVAAFSRSIVTPRPLASQAGIDQADAQVLDEAASYELLDRLGVPRAPFAVVDVDNLPEELPVPGPVVVKALSDRLPHKSDAGGVVLGVATAGELAVAARQIVASVADLAGVDITQVLVQSMVDSVGEVLVGVIRDPDAGPLVVLAPGGVLAEIFDDRSARLAPVEVDEARLMISETKGLTALAGYRGLPAGDLEALAHAVSAMSRIVDEEGSVLEAEVNPLLVLTEGVIAVDAMIRVAR